MSNSMDLQKVIYSPAGVYREPEEILDDQKLSSKEKKKALEQWKYDAILMETASAESMGGGERAKLGRIMKCLDTLA